MILVRRLAVLGLLALSLAPVVEWIPDELEAPWYRDVAGQWLVGLVAVVALAAVVARLSRSRPELWREGTMSGFLARLDPSSPRALGVVALAAFLAYAAIAGLIFDGKPLLIDEVVQLLQARTYGAGRLWIPVDPDPAFRSMLHVVEHDGKWFGHFPPGWPVLLGIADLFRVPWLAGPAIGAAGVAGFGLLLRQVAEPPSVRGGAFLLFALAPFPAFMAASHMNHAAALTWILLGLAGTVRLVADPRPGLGALVGLAFGMAMATRPADGLAFALPAAVWVLIAVARQRRWSVVVTGVIGGLVPLVAMLGVNLATTGSPTVSGYELLWGPNVSIGFHPAPWGPAHTPVRGLELVNLYLLRLNTFLFETPFPALLPAALALLLVRRLEPLDRVLLAGGAILLGLYWAYWHDGFYLGPRFVLPLAPVLALWTARLPRLVHGVTGSEWGRRATAWGLGFGAIGAIAFGIPSRTAIYSVGQPIMRFDPDRAAAAAGVRNAVVFVQESWGSQLVARLWALGVNRPDAERLYRTIDSCLLEEALTRFEAGGGPADGSVADTLAPLQADSARLVKSPFSPDPSERFLQGVRYGPRCVARINEDRSGFALHAPLWLARRSDILYARNLHERNPRLLAGHPDRAVYLLRQGPRDPEPRFVPISRDSILGAR